MKFRGVLSGAALAVTLVMALVGHAGAASAPTTGYDVSYPQCGRRLPTPGAFAIVGVNGGLPYSLNPCLATQYEWAAKSSGAKGPKASLYINTANPGPTLSSHWPTGQQAPKVCDGTWSTECAYDYGWNAAGDAFATATAALPAGAPATSPWWLDVETANSWNSQDLASKVSALQGYMERLTSLAPGQPVGIYSAAGTWATITGATSPSSSVNQPFASTPNWVAGFTAKTAPGGCSRSFTGGAVRYAQYVSGGIDNDYAC